jgi:hypothetical protein
MLPALGNMASRDNDLVRLGVAEISRRLPPGWRIDNLPQDRTGTPFGNQISIAGPDGRRSAVRLVVKRTLDPRQAMDLTRQPQLAPSRDAALTVVISPYLSPGVRDRLSLSGFAYVDLTGNSRLVLTDPGLYLKTSGADRNPDPSERPTRSLRGPKAGRIVRTLCDLSEPPGIRQIASRTNLDAGYVSRIVALLDRETLVERGPRGRISRVDWQRLLRRWAQEAPLENRGDTTSYLEPRGLSASLGRLRSSRLRYVITGSLAASRLAPIAPPRLAILYVESIDRAAQELSLRPAETGGNVLLLLPNDEWAFEGAKEEEGLLYAAPSQVAADLLTSPGRGPAEGEELIRWMAENQEKWRG